MSSWKLFEAYMKIMTSILSDNVQIPGMAEAGLLSESYAVISDSKRAELMTCRNGPAHCELESGNREEVRNLSIKKKIKKVMMTVMKTLAGHDLVRRDSSLNSSFYSEKVYLVVVLLIFCQVLALIDRLDLDRLPTDNADFVVQYARAYATASDSFLSTGNTGSAVHRRWSAEEDMPPLSSAVVLFRPGLRP